MPDPHQPLPNAPVSLVVVEVRFAGGADGPAMPMASQRAFRDLLGKDWVVQSTGWRGVELTIGPVAAASQAISSVIRYTVRDRTLDVAVTNETLTVETTSYRNYPTFREVVRHAAEAAAEVLQPDGIARIGMRYIDELRVPGATKDDPTIWQEWVDPELLAPKMRSMTGAGYQPGYWECVSQYAVGADMNLVLRYGPRPGPVNFPQPPLRRPVPADPGPWFSLDFDATWDPPGIPSFEPQLILDTCDSLHTPIRTLFDSLITERLLVEFERKDTDA